MRGNEGREEQWDGFFDDYYVKVAPASQPDDEALREASAVLRLVECKTDSLVLDIPCGFGRHSRALAKEGVKVVGADRSWPLLAEAVRRREGSWPLLVRADYRAIPFRDESFEVLLNLFTSFGFYSDLENVAVLKEFRRVLRPGGRFLMEIMNRDHLVRIFQAHDWQETEVGFVLSDRRFDPVAGVLTVTETLIAPDRSKNSHSYQLRVYTAGELIQMLHDAGFDEVQTFGGYEGQPFSPDTRLALLVKVAG